MSALNEIQQAIQKGAEQTGPSVVAVNRQGAGVVVGKDLVATNAHNLGGGRTGWHRGRGRGERDDGRDGERGGLGRERGVRGHGGMRGRRWGGDDRDEDGTVVQFADGRQAAAEIAGADADGDLAVLRVDTGDVAPVTWAETPAELGQVVVALANPRGRGLRATAGTVSSLGRSFRGPRGRRIPGGLEHTAPLGRGSSGGPVLDATGKVLGLNTHRLQDGFYLAVVADDELRKRIEALSAGEAPMRHRLGAAIAPPHIARHLRSATGLPETEGLLIRGIEEGGAADRAGLRRGDLLVSASGNPLTSVEDLYTVLDGVAAEGAAVDFGVVRATEELTVTVTFTP